MRLRALCPLIALALLAPAAAWAQPHHPRTAASDRPVSVTFDGGLASGSPGTGPAIGGRLTFDISDRLALEGSGGWLSRGDGAHGGSVAASLLVNLTDRDRKAVPYLAVGGGVYRAMFDMGAGRFFGNMGSQYAGSQVVPIAGMHGVGMMQGYTGAGVWTGQWSGPTLDVSQMPMFYVQRMGTMQVPYDGRWNTRSFTDPAISMGGGLRIDVSDRVFVRPDVRALVAFADGRSYSTGIFTVGVGYRF